VSAVSSSARAALTLPTAAVHAGSPGDSRYRLNDSRITTPGTRAAACSASTSKVCAPHPDTRSHGPTWVGNHTAAAAAEVVDMARSAATIRTSWPASSSEMAVVSPLIPEPTTTHRIAVVTVRSYAFTLTVV
jgi:hypothetical protein